MLFQINTPEILKDIVLALVRILLIVTFVYESRVKFTDLKKFAKSHGLSVPMAGFVATAEMLVAISMFLGILSQWAGLGLALLMIGTISMHFLKWHSPYWAAKKGWEYDLIMLVLGLVIFTFGPGSIALNALFTAS